MVVEPSFECCQIIDGLSNKFNSNILVYQCSGEDMNQIDDSDFDLCIFNSSLHHCYDPVKAIKNCHSLLKEKGQL
jgi:SAM-dependent methyltransferase